MLQAIDLVSTWGDVVPDMPLPDVFEYLPDALILANDNFRIIYLNPAAERLLGLPLEKVHGHSLDRVLKLQDGVTRKPVRVFDSLIRNDCFAGSFHLLSDSSGRRIPVQYSVAPTPAGSGVPGGYVISLRNASGLQHYIDTLQAQTTRDEHTRLLLRADLIKRLWLLLQEADIGEPHAFVYLDLDNVKSINDAAGHAAGEQAIRQIASSLSDVVRGHDMLARLGDDQFGLLLEHCPVERARQRAAQLHGAVESCVVRWNGSSLRLGVSIGLAIFKTRHNSLNTILAAAGAACGKARRNGGAGPRIGEVQLD